MQKSDLIVKTAEVMRREGFRKEVNFPRQVFTISNESGLSKEFVIRGSKRNFVYSKEDVKRVLDTAEEVLLDAIRSGGAVNIRGFGEFGVSYRTPRRTKHPVTGEEINIPPRLIPRFIAGERFKVSARMYEESLREGTEGEKDFPDIEGYVPGKGFIDGGEE